MRAARQAWIEVRQDERIGGEVSCPEVRKSLRFASGAGPVTIEIGRAPNAQIKLGLLPAD
ncbi:hypothetical protein FVE89_22460 [Methylobacterium sp. 2A]|nr:hypothetical protein [Methylobacterium sp. 2A]